MQTIILAAGESTRFWPLSDKAHKSLVKIMGKPLILWTIESIKKSGINNIIIIQSKEKNIEKEIGDRKDFGVNIKYLVQEEQKGMGNAVIQAEELIKEDFFIINPNFVNIQDIIKKIIEKQKETNAKMVLVGTKTERPWDYGIIELNGDKVVKIIEKPEKGKEPSNIKVAGIYFLPKEFFDYYKKIKEHMYSYEDSLQLIIEENETRIILIEKETNTLKYPWDIFNLKKEIMDSYINGQNIAESTETGRNVIIEGNVWIGENTKIYENVVIKGPCYIGNNCVIGNSSIIRKYSDIEDNVIIGAFSEISNTLIQEGTHIHTGFFGDSIIGKNCRIGAGAIVANRRLDRKEIKVVVKGEEVNSGLDYLGAIIGNDTKLGISVGIMPGIMIGSNVVIGPQTQVKENIESNCTYYTEFKGIKKNNDNKDNNI